ncbi:MAG: hypothetical protein ABSG43_07230 [Solirubrobacteraceae bacterium]|jgi:hypothetical protein
MRNPRIALATCAALPELAEDEPLLLDALHARGASVEVAVWDDPRIDWHAYELVVVRTTWDYALRRDQFVAWAERVPRIANCAEVIRWNTDKRYLAELPRAVPTEFVAPGARWRAPAAEYVVKPAVSAGASDTARYGPGDEQRARSHVGELHAANRTAIVQPYLTAVDEHGETALVFIGGEYSHAIRKGQMLARGDCPATPALFVQEEIRARCATAAELAAAEEVLDALDWDRGELLYARVDLIAGSDGAPLLLELELTEPSLFLSYGPGAAQRLAARVLERLER